MKPMAILATGMITGVGLDAPAACAAIRCAIDLFQETRFMDQQGEWMIGSEVPLDPPSRGREKLVRMAASAIGECLAVPESTSVGQVPLLLCVAEENRPGRFAELDHTLLDDIGAVLKSPLHPASAVMANGRVSGVEAVLRARELLDDGHRFCLVAGTDTFLAAPTLAAFEREDRLLTSTNSNGFIPGEAGAAVLLSAAEENVPGQLVCRGVGFGREQATIESEEPLRADGMAAAVRAALLDAGATFDDVDYRLTDCNGEQYAFKEAALTLSRTMRQLKPEFDIWHPADCIGEVGAAIVPIVLGVAKAAAEKKYAPGPGVLCHFGNDDGARAAMVLHFSSGGGV